VWCRAKGKDWYLPAIDELKLLLLDSSVHQAVNSTLKEHRGDRLIDIGEREWYLSSTEHVNNKKYWVWVVSMSDDATYSGCKGNDYYVRAVSAF
jgi:hypothetical protein